MLGRTSERENVVCVEWVVGAGRRGEVVMDVLIGVGVVGRELGIAGISDVVGVAAGDGVVLNTGLCVVNEVASAGVGSGNAIVVAVAMNGVVKGEVTEDANPVAVASLVVSVNESLTIGTPARVVGIVVAPIKSVVLGPVVAEKNVPVKNGTIVLNVSVAVAVATVTPDKKGMTPIGIDTPKPDVVDTIIDPLAVEGIPLAFVEARLETLEAELAAEIEESCPFPHVPHRS